MAMGSSSYDWFNLLEKLEPAAVVTLDVIESESLQSSSTRSRSVWVMFLRLSVISTGVVGAAAAQCPRNRKNTAINLLRHVNYI